MTIGEYLASRGLSQKVIGELLPFIPSGADEGVFCDAASIMDPDKLSTGRDRGVSWW